MAGLVAPCFVELQALIGWRRGPPLAGTGARRRYFPDPFRRRLRASLDGLDSRRRPGRYLPGHRAGSLLACVSSRNTLLGGAACPGWFHGSQPAPTWRGRSIALHLLQYALAALICAPLIQTLVQHLTRGHPVSGQQHHGHGHGLDRRTWSARPPPPPAAGAPAHRSGCRPSRSSRHAPAQRSFAWTPVTLLPSGPLNMVGAQARAN